MCIVLYGTCECMGTFVPNGSFEGIGRQSKYTGLKIDISVLNNFFYKMTKQLNCVSANSFFLETWFL